jgi:hypothetical protein
MIWRSTLPRDRPVAKLPPEPVPTNEQKKLRHAIFVVIIVVMFLWAYLATMHR